MSSHGITKLPAYVARVTDGVMAVDPEMTLDRELRGSALPNAQNGLGRLAIDPDAFVGRDVFRAAVDETLALIEGLEPVEGDRVYYPGLIEHARGEVADAARVRLSERTMESLRMLAERFDLRFAE